MRNNWRSGNSVDLLINGEAFFPRVYERIAQAKKEIIIETFILAEDKVGKQLQQSLIAAAKRGVQVDLTVDDYGTWDLSTEFVKAMVDAGVRLHIFDPQPKIWGTRLNLFRRLHRKLVVIDQQVAFIGGINYSADHLMDFGEKAKQDYAVELQGPIVADIHQTCMLLLLRGSTRKERRAYIKNARAEVPPAEGKIDALLAVRDNQWHKKDIEKQYLLAARTAKHRLVIANAYFFPHFFLLRAFRRAAQRGVDVTLILQGCPDMPWVSNLSRLLYSYLLRGNVKIYEYCQRSLHGKIAIMDDEWVTVGSSNLDPLSCSLNLEANVMLRDKALNNRLHEHLQKLIEDHCDLVDMETAKRGYWWRIPLIFVSFHFLRHFPSIAGWLPAHIPVLEMVRSKKQSHLNSDVTSDEDSEAEESTLKTYSKESIS